MRIPHSTFHIPLPLHPGGRFSFVAQLDCFSGFAGVAGGALLPPRRARDNRGMKQLLTLNAAAPLPETLAAGDILEVQLAPFGDFPGLCAGRRVTQRCDAIIRPRRAFRLRNLSPLHVQVMNAGRATSSPSNFPLLQPFLS